MLCAKTLEELGCHHQSADSSACYSQDETGRIGRGDEEEVCGGSKLSQHSGRVHGDYPVPRGDPK